MDELLPHALGVIEWVNRQFDESSDGDNAEFVRYAADRAQRRLSAIAAARGANVADIDLDHSPERLEETFGEEDERAFAEAERMAGREWTR